MFEKVAANLPKEICQEFRLALTRGYWRNGLPLTDKQRKTCEEVLFFHPDNEIPSIH